MKIGIILYSNTGNTRLVANQLESTLAEAGHEVFIEEVMSEGGPTKVVLTEKPDTSPFDLIVFAAPVQGFRLCVTMEQYLKNLPDSFNKKFACFVTQQLPFKWLGGEHAARQIKEIVEGKGGHFIGHGVINWSRSDRQERIDLLMLHIKRLIEIETL